MHSVYTVYMLYAQSCIDGLSVYATVYIVYTHSSKSKRLRMFTEVNIYALYYLSHWCHTGVTLLFFDLSAPCDR